MKFILVIKQGAKTLTMLPGRIDVDHRVSELHQIIYLEQALERLLGYRFHINELVEERKDKNGG